MMRSAESNSRYIVSAWAQLRPCPYTIRIVSFQCYLLLILKVYKGVQPVKAATTRSVASRFCVNSSIRQVQAKKNHYSAQSNA